MKRRRPRLVGPPVLGPVSAGEITILVSEEEKAGAPVLPQARFLLPPDTPPDTLAAMRQADAETEAWLVAQRGQ